jgi:GNAT superfamily N-acetyltransferase
VPRADAASCLIRRAARQEVPEIERIVLAAFEQFRGEAPPVMFEAYLEKSRNVAAHWDDAEVLVAEARGQITGTVTFYADASTQGVGLPGSWAGFRTLAVAPDARGHGIGRALVHRCIDATRALDIATVAIHTTAFMTTACRIYESLGFRRCPEHDYRASTSLGIARAPGEVAVMAYRLDLAGPIIRR